MRDKYIKPTAIAKSDKRLESFLALNGHAELTETYRTRAMAIANDAGCANCRGTEALRSCVNAYRELRRAVSQLTGTEQETLRGFLDGKYGAELAALEGLLINDYRVKLDAKFGEALFSQDALTQGIQREGTLVKAMNSSWYPVLKALLVKKNGQPMLKGVLSRGTGLAITKQSAHAHAVVSRASISIAIRFGFMEMAACLHPAHIAGCGRSLRCCARRSVSLIRPPRCIRSSRTRSRGCATCGRRSTPRAW